MNDFTLKSGEARDDSLAQLIRFIHKLSKEKRWRFSWEEAKPRRSLAQNRYLWALYQRILDIGGEELGGWTKDDLHDFFLIEHFGSEVLEGFGRKRLKPLKRSSKLSKTEFVDFVAHIQQFMAERGVCLPDPDDWEEAA